jgi:hypothetical protein
MDTSFRRRLASMITTMPASSVGVGLASFGAGIAAEEGVKFIIRQVMAQTATRLTAMTAAASAVGAGATGTSAAAGGSIGTLAEPGGGTLIGVAAGLIIGAFVDLWMSHRLEERLAVDCHEFLEKTQRNLLEGQDHQPGLKKVLDETNTLLDCTFRSVIKETLVKGTP